MFIKENNNAEKWDKSKRKVPELKRVPCFNVDFITIIPRFTGILFVGKSLSKLLYFIVQSTYCSSCLYTIKKWILKF